MIEQMPQDATADDILGEVFFRIQVDAGLQELDDGFGIPHEAVEERMAGWLSR